jgi:hypothetical protein
VRKYLGVLMAVAALGVMSWAQGPEPSQVPVQPPAQLPAPDQAPAPTPTPSAPTPTATVPAPPPAYPRFELFAGGSYAESGFFNAGHWAGLPGWDASIDANVTRWLGFIAEGGEFFGTSKIPTAVPTPFPTCPPFCPNTSPTFNVTTREYNFLFGVQFARRKWDRWTPIGELLYGHGGTRGEVTAQGQGFSEVGSGRSIVAGAGIDRRLNQRFSLRIKADYLETGAFKQKQDNFRFSVGIVIRNVHKKKRKLEDETEPEP